MKSICVYCGSSSRVDKVLLDAARKLGILLAERNIRLVYGGGAVGLMGELAKSCLLAGGTVVGVIPRFMHEEGWSLEGVSELIIVDTMHARKAKMLELSDALVALPGGCGTLEELFEAITWKQLGLTTQPIVLMNLQNYFQPILTFFEQAVDGQFMRKKHLEMWQVANTPEELFSAIENSVSWNPDYRKLAAI